MNNSTKGCNCYETVIKCNQFVTNCNLHVMNQEKDYISDKVCDTLMDVQGKQEVCYNNEQESERVVSPDNGTYLADPSRTGQDGFCNCSV